MDTKEFYDSCKENARTDETPASPIEIPFASLSSDAQIGVIDAFIWREGTDYGSEEVSHERKQESIRRQISVGKVKLVFDPNSESVTLMTEREWRHAQA